MGSTSLHSNFTWIGSSPTNHSWPPKIGDTGQRDAEDCIGPTAFPRFDTIA